MPCKNRNNWSLFLVILLLPVIGLTPVFATVKQNEEREIYIPSTISGQARKTLEQLSRKKIYAQGLPAPDDLDGWRTVQDDAEKSGREVNQKAVNENRINVTETKLGSIPVLELRPIEWKDNGKVLLYTHGGAYTRLSAHSTLVSSAPMCHATGLRLISVDYTTAPFATWNEIQEQVISVVMALLKKGYKMKDIAMFGDSAGGGLVMSVILRMRDRGLGLPPVVVLWSPWADLTNTGDTAHTLQQSDPILTYQPNLENSALAYAGGLNLSDPRISPLYADFKQGFPPCLLVDGTKDIFLSTTVRLYRALEAADQEVDLDLYEGMWHVFQSVPLPESEISIKKSSEFIRKRLN